MWFLYWLQVVCHCPRVLLWISHLLPAEWHAAFTVSTLASSVDRTVMEPTRQTDLASLPVHGSKGTGSVMEAIKSPEWWIGFEPAPRKDPELEKILMALPENSRCNMWVTCHLSDTWTQKVMWQCWGHHCMGYWSYWSNLWELNWTTVLIQLLMCRRRSLQQVM